MLKKIINFKEFKEFDFRLDAEFIISFDKIYQKYIDFIGEQTIKLSECISFKNENSIKSGDLYCCSFLTRDSIFGKFNQESIKKGIVRKVELISNVVTENYLIWLFRQEPLLDYINLFSKGFVLPYISPSDLLKLDIPLPKAGQKYSISSYDKYNKEFSLLFEELNKCEKHSLYLSAIVLMGSVAEGILNGILKLEEINTTKEGRKIEEATLGKKIEYLKQNDNIIESFKIINEKRNCIHINKLNKNPNLEQSFIATKEAFTLIIKELGI